MKKVEHKNDLYFKMLLETNQIITAVYLKQRAVYLFSNIIHVYK